MDTNFQVVLVSLELPIPVQATIKKNLHFALENF